jgi:DNA-3-methyladenine glycosylase II
VERRVIRPTAPFDAPAAFAFLARCRDEAIDRVEGGTLRRALLVAGQPIAVTVTSTGTIDAPRLDVSVEAEALRRDVAEGAVSAVRRLLNTDANPAPFAELAGRHPLVGPIAAKWPGIRPVGTPTVFEALVWAITGQHVALQVACMLKGRLAKLLGSTYRGLVLFPEPAALATADPDLLGRNGFTRAKHGAIIGLAQAVVAGDFDPEALQGAGREDAVARLVSFRGIGPWTAEYVLARGLGHPDAFPAGDVGIRQAIERLLGRPRVLQGEVEEFAEPFEGYRAWLAFVLWSTL